MWSQCADDNWWVGPAGETLLPIFIGSGIQEVNHKARFLFCCICQDANSQWTELVPSLGFIFGFRKGQQLNLTPCPTPWHPTPRPGQAKRRGWAKRKGQGVYWDGALRLISGPVWGRRPPRQWHGCEVLPEVMGTRQSSPCPGGHRSLLDLFYSQTAHLSGRRSDQPCSVERES